MLNSVQSETQSVWQSMPGAQPLHDIYGYWPTLHDASIRSMNFGFSGRELEMVFDYSDLVGGDQGEHSISTRITMRWHGVTESKLRVYSDDLYGVEFTRVNGLIETRFEEYAWGTDGFILSTGIEVIGVAPAPDMSAFHENDAAHHEIRMSAS